MELPANFNLQLKKSNILFAFDNIALERTTSFSVPATPHNVAIFGWSNDFHYYGEKGRKRMQAQLQMDGVTKDGYLYITKYTPDAFECVFVTGELLGLADIKALGDWSQFILPSNGVSLDSAVKFADDGDNYSAARVEYKTDGYVMPSWKLASYAEMALNGAGVLADWGEVLDKIASHRIVIGKAKGVTETPCTFTRGYLAEQTSATPYPVLNSTLMDDAGELVGVITNAQSDYPIFKVKTADAVQYYGYVQQWIARQDLTLSFADDTPDTLFLASAQMNGTFAFLGGYEFAADGTITGEPLKGREIELQTGQTFLLISQNDYLRPGVGEFEGWTIANETLTANVVVKGANEQPNNAYIRVKDNVPAMTIVELVKVIAALSGKILSYHAGEIVFVDNIAGGESVELDKPLKWSNLTRSVGDYAQKNLVTFKDGELTATYTIDNVNIEQEKELLAIPMNAGSDVAGDLFVAGDTEEYTISRYDETKPIYLQRIEVTKNESLEKILFQSTSLTAEVKMSEREFDKLPFDSQLRFDNALYAWTDGVWSNGIASLSLSRLKGEYTPPPPPPPYIPVEYQQVEWLRNSGANWINPNIKYTGNCDWEVRFIEKNYNINNMPVVGSSQWGSVLVLNYWNNNVLLFWDSPRNAYTEGYDEIGIVNLEYKNGNVKISYSLSETVYTFYREMTGHDIYINNSENRKPSATQAYLLNYFAFRESGVLIRELIPCYRKADLVAGMYDRVNGVFYTNAGTGSFIVGPDINT